MNKTTPAAALLRLLVVLVLAVFALPAMARPVPVKMRVISGGLAFYMPADAYNKPILSWDANLKFLVHVVVQSTPSQMVDETSGRAYMRGHAITLCYRVRKIKGAGSEGSAAFPEIMEFYIPAASTRQKYDISIQRDCK